MTALAGLTVNKQKWFILDPSHVIGLYPNLLPQEFRKQLDYPSQLPDLEGGELEKGLSALQDYLTQVTKYNLCTQETVRLSLTTPWSGVRRIRERIISSSGLSYSGN